MIFHWFKYKVPVERHFSEIVARMMKDDIAPLTRTNFWDYIKREFQIKQHFSWRHRTNYMVFRNEQHYLAFLLKL